eukprot:2967482-Rhodomonas_salina.2
MRQQDRASHGKGHGEIKYKLLRSPYSLHQECGCLSLISQCRNRCRTLTSAPAAWSATAEVVWPLAAWYKTLRQYSACSIKRCVSTGHFVLHVECCTLCPKWHMRGTTVPGIVYSRCSTMHSVGIVHHIADSASVPGTA